MIFLDNAGGSHPKPDEVQAETARLLAEPPAATTGRGAALLDDLRSEAAGLLGASDPARVVLTLNCTDALNMAIKGLLRPGDHVVTTSIEHHALARPLTHLQMKGEISLTRVEPGADGQVEPGKIQAALAHRTRLVALAHASNVLGTVQPIEEIARLTKKRGVPLLVDAAQSAGLVPITADAWGVDLLAASGHKGLFGPAGTGLLLVGDGIRIRPLREGASGDPALATQPLGLPESLEAGTPNLPGLAGLAAGVRFVRGITVERIQAHVSLLTKRFIGAIGLDERYRLFAARGDLPRTGTVSLNLTGFAPRLLAELLERRYGILVRAGLHNAPGAHQAIGTAPNGTVRVSIGWFNTEQEIDRAVAALRAVADAGVQEALEEVEVRPERRAETRG